MRRPIADTLRDIRGGEALEDLSAKLQELVQAVQSTNAGGTLVLKISVKPMKGSTEAVVCKATVTVKAPVFDDAGTVLFPTPDGNLERSYHKQPELPGITLAASNASNASNNGAAQQA